MNDSYGQKADTPHAEKTRHIRYLAFFDVQMPLLNGEGEVKAFQRLRDAIDKPFKGKSYPYD
jgi:hypothetical protein